MKVDVVIIGAGPAGLSASIFASRAGLNVVCLEELSAGGRAALSYEITNYPAFKSISGFDLTEKMREHAESMGVRIEYSKVKKLKKTKFGFSVTASNMTYQAKKVIIACGCRQRKLNIENEDKFIGKGVSFCASCDGMFFKDKIVAVIGGGNTAMDDVRYLSRLASKVYLINRRDVFRAGVHELDKIKKIKNVHIISNAVLTKMEGKDRLEKITINEKGTMRELSVDGVFEAIGAVPELNFIDFDIELNASGYIIVDENMCTSEKNLFACGDIISKSFRQVITACADGAIAGNACIGE